MVTLVLRDPSRTESIRALIRKEGGRAFSQTAFNFETIFDCKEAISFIKQPSKFDFAIFVSPQGVMSMRRISIKLGVDLPKSMPCAGPGAGTRKALLGAGFRNVASPPGVGDLIELLKESKIGKIAQKRVALIQAQDSHSKAAQEIRKRKAIPIPVMCYKRTVNEEGLWPEDDAEMRQDINSIISYDAPSLDILLKKAGSDEQRIKKMPIGVIHPAIAQKASEMGFENIITSGDSKHMILQLKELVSKESTG